MIVRLSNAGAVVQDPDDLADLRLNTDLDPDDLRKVLATTGTGELSDDHTALLDVAVLRSLAVLRPTAPGWSTRWKAMIEDARGQGLLSADGRSVRVPVSRAPR
ncbi:hypothetical protein [Pseudonocardia adelaidensis]|uniref:Uncharacterized protein n=1 Tax=Pseudonocardia adelaidensis TaxID=648754 RepID=A0ABP9NYV1_9PSEU